MIASAIALLSAIAVVWGAVRAIAYEETQPARGLIVFGSIAFAVCLADWIDGRRGT